MFDFVVNLKKLPRNTEYVKLRNYLLKENKNKQGLKDDWQFYQKI